MTTRKFYKTVLQVEVLSEEPIGDMDLEQVSHEIVEGDFSGQSIVMQTKELNGKEAAAALVEQGSDPEFFMIDEEGNDI